MSTIKLFIVDIFIINILIKILITKLNYNFNGAIYSYK
jgi:hypothetical protein